MKIEPFESEPFAGAKLKIERAKRHIADFRTAFQAFANSDIVRIVTEPNPETGRHQIRIRLSQPIPGELRLTAADALYNLRASLDQAMCQCAILAKRSPKHTYFPHGKDISEFKISLGEKCKKVPEEVRAAVANIEPYYGGDGYRLRILHDLNIIDKHTDLIGLHPKLRRLLVTRGKFSEFNNGIDTWHRDIDKFDVAKIDVPHINQNVKGTLTVTFNDIKAVQNQSVTQVLTELCDEVGNTVGIIEKTMLCAGSGKN